MDNSKEHIEKGKAELDKKNQLYPVFLKLDQLELLLVGGGNVGLEKLHSLLANSPEAKISIVAPEVKDEIKKLVLRHPSCKIYQREFQNEDLENKDLIVLATDKRELHEEIKGLAIQKGILVNVADTPDLCDFYLGSIVQKGNLKIAISTNGKSPTIAKRIKEVLNETLPDEIDDLLNNMQSIRSKMSVDFAEKVKRLNELTRSLTENGE
jgi:siroheme synthase-like protein